MQRKVGEGEWSPGEDHILAMSGWQLTSTGRYCSATCRSLATARGELPGAPKAPIAVTSPIVALEAARAAQRATSARSAAEAMLSSVGGAREQTAVRKGTR
jgi:hypothetical protein